METRAGRNRFPRGNVRGGRLKASVRAGPRSHRAARLEAAPRRPPRFVREEDAGIEEPTGIERPLDSPHDVVHSGPPDPRERLGADPADPVLRGRSAAEPLEDRVVELRAQRPHPFEVEGIRRVEERAVVRVAVADVAVDSRDRVVSLREVDEEGDEFRNPVPRDDRVLDKPPCLAGARPLADHRKQGPSDLPKGRLPLRIVRDLDAATETESRPDSLDDDLRDPVQIAFVELDEQHRPGGYRYARGIPREEAQRLPIQ